jgi:aspartate/methionine/tyrosine aminotransferase
LRQAIAERWGDGRPETVLVGNGSNELGFMILNALLEPGDEIVALEPIYHTMDNPAAALGCTLKRWPIRPQNGWQPDFDHLAELLTPNTRLVTVNFPHNPTGASLTRAQQQRLIAMVAEVDAYLIWDAAFEDLVHEGEPLPNPFRDYEKTCTIYTMSKCYGLPGSRIGWAICPPDLFERFLLMRDYTCLFISPLLELVALKAVAGADALIAGKMAQVRTNLTRLDQFIADHEEWLDWTRPKGGVTGFVRLRNVTDSDTFCRRLAKETGILMVPGTCFKNPDHVRLGFGGPTEPFQQGLARFSPFLKAYRAT